MSTHDLNIQDQAAQAARLDIQSAIRAVAQCLSSSSAPTNNLDDGMLWYDTSNDQLKIREGSSWVSIGEVDGSTFKANVGYASTAQAQNGTDTPLTMNPARVKEAIAAQTTSSIGVGQTWQAFSTGATGNASFRNNNEWYQNTSSLPIQVAINCRGGNGSGEPAIYVGTATNSYITIATWPSNDGEYERSAFSFIVPVNHYYKLTSGTRIHWSELRA
jgi:hypothetical protein